MKEYASIINALDLRYLGPVQNSNSYAFTYVRSLGFAGASPLPGIWAPGWKDELPY